MKKSCFLVLVLISFFFVKPISAKTLGAQEISVILNTHSENQLRFRRDFSKKELELSGDFEQLRPQGSDWAFELTSQGYSVSCVLSEDEAMEFVETGRGTNIFLTGKIQTVRKNDSDNSKPILELDQCRIRLLSENQVASIPIEGRWKGCNVRIGKKKYNGKSCSLYVTIRKQSDGYTISDLKRSDGRPIEVVAADFAGGALPEWSTKTIQTGVITSYNCQFEKKNQNSFICEWEEPKKEGTIKFQRLR